ncbi:MAG TPA: DNA-binding protein, partial [Microbacterium sp.]|nr:DNA-binding protein [Microbacterium sp.]
MTTSPELASAEPRHDRTPATVEELEQEGDVAADFLEGLLDIADIDGDLDLDVRAGRAYVSVEAPAGGSVALIAAPDTVQAL